MARRPGTTPRWRQPLFWVLLSIPTLLLLYAGLLLATLPAKSGREASFTDFSRRANDNLVQSAVLLDFDDLILFSSAGVDYYAALPNNDVTIDRLLGAAVAQGVPLEVDQQRVKGLIAPFSFIIPGLLFVAVFFLIFLLGRSGGSLMRVGKRRGEGSDDQATFADVAGADEVVAELREVRDFLKHPERYKAFGAEPPRGVLLVGPPGTGKTLLARAVAGEAGVPFYSISGTEFVEMWVGVGAARVRDLFKRVRQEAPAILFIDELDAAGRARGVGGATGGESEREQTLNQLLVEMDGFDRYSGVVLIGATNRPDVLDPAILRRGRFDRQIVVDLPDRAGRLAILEVHARGKRLERSVRLEALAAQTPGMSGADLASVMNEAAILSARKNKPVIGVADLEEAVDRVLAGNERRARVLTPEEKRAVAYHEAGHAIVAWALPGTDPVTKITVVSRGTSLGLTWMVPEQERFLTTETELRSRMAMSLGGMAAEELVLGETTSGPRADLRTATRIARTMVCELGMSETLGRLALGQIVGSPFLGSDVHQADYSDEVGAEIDREMRRLTNEAFALASDVLTANRDLLDSLAMALVERETLREAELQDFMQAVVRPERDLRSDEPHLGRLAIRGLPSRSTRPG